eukprot:1161688-Pelagomonas_calceolata.AAC.8
MANTARAVPTQLPNNNNGPPTRKSTHLMCLVVEGDDGTCVLVPCSTADLVLHKIVAALKNCSRPCDAPGGMGRRTFGLEQEFKQPSEHNQLCKQASQQSGNL